MVDSFSNAIVDEIDRKILLLLQENGRMTNAALAEAVGLTPTPMLSRIRRLEQSGVIKGYMAVVDPAKVGKPILAFVHVTLKGHGLPLHQKLLDIVAELEEVIECHHIAGEEDFLLKVAARDIAELEGFLLRRLSTSGVIGRVKTTFVLSTSKSQAPIVPGPPAGSLDERGTP
jgi:Lrp/AsnC family transcriptional regulator, leucine-responsive regulatory protein